MNNAPLYRLGSVDFIKGAAAAVLGGVVVGVVTVLHTLVSAPGFDVFQIDWVGLGHNLVNSVIIGAEGGIGGYLAKNFLSNEEGDIPALGRFGKWSEVE